MQCEFNGGLILYGVEAVGCVVSVVIWQRHYCLDGINKKTVSFWIVLLEEDKHGSRRKGTRVTHWFSVPPHMVLASHSNSSVGSTLTLYNSCNLLLILYHFGFIFQTQTKAIKIMPTRYSDNSGFCSLTVDKTKSNVVGLNEDKVKHCRSVGDWI